MMFFITLLTFNVNLIIIEYLGNQRSEKNGSIEWS